MESTSLYLAKYVHGYSGFRPPLRGVSTASMHVLCKIKESSSYILLLVESAVYADLSKISSLVPHEFSIFYMKRGLLLYCVCVCVCVCVCSLFSMQNYTIHYCIISYRFSVFLAKRDLHYY